MAKALDIPGLFAATSFRESAAAAVEVRAGEVFDHADGALDLDDIEHLHDMRVSTRRLRAVLEIFATCFPKAQHAAALADVKDLADALGERRDPDVAVASLEKIAKALAPEDRPGIESLVSQLEEDRREANHRLVGALEEADRTGLGLRLLALAAEARRS